MIGQKAKTKKKSSFGTTARKSTFQNLPFIIDELNEIISKHNLRAKNHNTEVISSREKIELHSIAVALSGLDYKKTGEEVKDAEKNEKEALDAINKNNSDIAELEKQTSDIGKAIIAINKHLEEFFGRKEIGYNDKGMISKYDGKVLSPKCFIISSEGLKEITLFLTKEKVNFSFVEIWK